MDNKSLTAGRVSPEIKSQYSQQDAILSSFHFRTGNRHPSFALHCRTSLHLEELIFWGAA
jgi:hypothetical protein